MLSSILPRILYMNTISLADARADFSRIVETAATTHERFDVTKNGERAVVIMSADDYDSLIETLEILADRELMADIEAAKEDLKAGRTFSLDEVKEALKASGRIK